MIRISIRLRLETAGLNLPLANFGRVDGSLLAQNGAL